MMFASVSRSGVVSGSSSQVFELGRSVLRGYQSSPSIDATYVEEDPSAR
jgi:hypothetical protein